MQQRTKFLLVSFMLSLPLWWGANILGKNIEEYFVFKELSKNPQIISAQLNFRELTSTPSPTPTPEIIESLKPEPTPEAKAIISVALTLDDESNVISQNAILKKAVNEKLPIASLTKLMTALVALENYDLLQPIIISYDATSQDGDMGQFKVGEIFSAKEILYSMLMESSNDAAYALSEAIGTEAFVNLMNLEANKLGLENTNFSNPMGFDSKDNYSSAEDLVKLSTHFFQKPLILEILSTKEKNIYTSDGIIHHTAINTNELLRDTPEIVGGKTGYTAGAQGCLISILKGQGNNNYFINVILGSVDRFGEMKEIIKRVNKDYAW